jgi:hypothetical protein
MDLLAPDVAEAMKSNSCSPEGATDDYRMLSMVRDATIERVARSVDKSSPPTRYATISAKRWPE